MHKGPGHLQVHTIRIPFNTVPSLFIEVERKKEILLEIKVDLTNWEWANEKRMSFDPLKNKFNFWTENGIWFTELGEVDDEMKFFPIALN